MKLNFISKILVTSGLLTLPKPSFKNKHNYTMNARPKSFVSMTGVEGSKARLKVNSKDKSSIQAGQIYSMQANNNLYCVASVNDKTVVYYDAQGSDCEGSRNEMSIESFLWAFTLQESP